MKERNRHTNAEMGILPGSAQGGKEYQQSITSKETHDIGTPSVPKNGWKEKLVIGVWLEKWIGRGGSAVPGFGEFHPLAW